MSKSGEKNGKEPNEKAQHGVGGGMVLLWIERGGEKESTEVRMNERSKCVERREMRVFYFRGESKNKTKRVLPFINTQLAFAFYGNNNTNKNKNKTQGLLFEIDNKPICEAIYSFLPF